MRRRATVPAAVAAAGTEPVRRRASAPAPPPRPVPSGSLARSVSSVAAAGPVPSVPSTRPVSSSQPGAAGGVGGARRRRRQTRESTARGERRRRRRIPKGGKSGGWKGARLVKEGLGGIPTHAAMVRPDPFTALPLASLDHSGRGQIIQERGYIPHGGERPRDGKIPRGGAQPRALTVADEGRVHHVDVNSHRLERPGSLVAPGLGRGGGMRGGSPWHDGRGGAV
eukprot:scaffold17160_cov81-Isochrysis_galbana.AAC.2